MPIGTELLFNRGNLIFRIPDDEPTKRPNITKVIFHEPATIVHWSDGSKTVVKCQDGDTFDREKGLALAIAKKFFGNTGYYNNLFRKWIEES